MYFFQRHVLPIPFQSQNSRCELSFDVHIVYLSQNWKFPIIFIFGVWNNRVKGILVVDFKNLKNFDFEKKKFFSGLRQKFLKIQFSLIFSKILIEFYFLRSNLNLECVQLSFDVHIVYLSQNWKFPTILIDVTSFKNVQKLVTCRIQLVAPVWPAGVLAGVQWPLEWYFTKIL